MTDTGPRENFVQAMADNDTFVKSALIGDFVGSSTSQSMIIRRHFTEVMVFPVTHYKITITTLAGTTYSTTQPIASAEYIHLLSKGDEVTIENTTYRVSHSEFIKQSDGEWTTKVYWQPILQAS